MLFAAVALGDDRAVPLTVCADPNDLPFSNQAQQGFENKIAQLIAVDLHHPLRYFGGRNAGASSARPWAWRNATFGSAWRMAWSTWSARVPITARPTSSPRGNPTGSRASRWMIHDCDPASIGVQMLGTESNNTPPAHALAERGIISNVRGFMVYGDAAQANPSAAILDALVKRQIDIALVWGPQAGFYARHSPVALHLEPVTPAADRGAPMTYEISMAVRVEGPLRPLIEASSQGRGAPYPCDSR